MENFFLGFLTGGSLILAIGPQNLFVIEQGLKKKFVFSVTTICFFSDVLLIFLGIYLFNLFNYLVLKYNFYLNLLLIIFLLNFIRHKIKDFQDGYNIKYENEKNDYKLVIFKTLGFTYLNPHVYSDTMFILGNFSKNFEFHNKIFFGLGASFASFIYFYFLGYSAKFFSSFIKKDKVWRKINLFIIIYMSVIILYVAQTLI